MNKSIFEMAHERLDGLGLSYDIVPAVDINAESYDFKDKNEALSAISRLNQMIYDWGISMVRVELVIGNNYYVTLEQLDEDEYGNEPFETPASDFE